MSRTPSQRPTRFLASLFLGATVALTACAPDTGEAGDELVAESEQPLTNGWTWNDVPGTKCGNGSQTGFGISLGTSKDLVIYLEGGGMCWDENTCGAGLASYFTSGYNGTTFAGQASGIFDRTKANNPYKSSTIVYVPYCTGDYHSGDVVGGVNKTLHFNGRINLALDLAKIKAAVPNPSRVTLSGSSAGGFGSLFNYETVAKTFAGKRVDLVTDSGPILWNGNGATVFAPLPIWNTQAALPAAVGGDIRQLYRYYSVTYPSSRFAYVGFDQDPTMALGYTVLPSLYREELRQKLVFGALAPLKNWKHFVAAGQKHTMLYATDTTSQNNRCNWLFGMCFPQSYGPTISLNDWLTKMYNDDPTWAKQSALLE